MPKSPRKSHADHSHHTHFTDHGVSAGVISNIKKGIAGNLFNGATVGIVTPQGREIVSEGVVHPQGPKPTGSKMYDLGSITKAFVAVLLHMLLAKKGRGHIDHFTLESHVAEHLQISGPYVEKLKVKHLLWFLTEFATPTMCSMTIDGQDSIETILKSGLAASPGRTFNYCNHTSVVLGLLLESVTRRSLHSLLGQYIFEPLGMRQTTFFPHEFEGISIGDFVPTENWLRGVVHDESARHLLHATKKTIGSAGLFSTTVDMLQFLEMFIREGTSLSGERILPKGIIGKFGVNQTRGRGESFGHGFGLWSRFSSGFDDGIAVSSPKAFIKSGFTGCIMAFFPHDKVGFFIGTDFLTLGRRNKGPLFEWMTKTISDVIRTLRKDGHSHSHAHA